MYIYDSHGAPIGKIELVDEATKTMLCHGVLYTFGAILNDEELIGCSLHPQEHLEN